MLSFFLDCRLCEKLASRKGRTSPRPAPSGRIPRTCAMSILSQRATRRSNTRRSLSPPPSHPRRRVLTKSRYTPLSPPSTPDSASAAAAAAAGERPRLPATLKATAAAAAVPAQDRGPNPELGDQAEGPGERSRRTAESGEGGGAGRRARPVQEEARGLSQTAVQSFIVPGSDSESEEASGVAPMKEGREAGVPVKVKEPGAEINLNNLKDFF
mmetsp:Transcript_4504/g.13641  ORF Transcript_4504/g.13641 Transcript_4504/m.13641 type:complete len:213 (-) Transcript_4504:47-685(-)